MQSNKNVELVCSLFKQVGYNIFAEFVKNDNAYLYPGVRLLEYKAKRQNRGDILDQLLEAGLIN